MRFVLALLALMLLANPVLAQNTAPKTQAPTINVPSADQKITKAMANNFYKNCVRGKKPDLFDDLDMADSCACQASTITQKMTVTEMKALSNFTSPTGKKALRKFVYDVSMPCMISPLNQVAVRNCKTGYGTRSQLRDPIAACKCAGSEAVRYLQQIGGQMAEAQILLYPQMNSDPIETLMRTVEFRGEINDRALKCVQKYSAY